jgi:flagellin
MAQVINTNISSLNAQRNLNASQGSLATSLQRLSTGLRINSAKDDAAGLAISERFTSQIRGLTQAARNANDGISLAQTGEGALTEMNTALQRIRELSVQSANATNSASDRSALNNEVQQMIAEIDRIATQTSFNGTKILNTTGGFSATFQVGANVSEVISTSIDQVTSTALGVSTNYSTVATTINADFALRAESQAANGFSSSTLNGFALADVAAGSNSIDKINAINASSSGVTAFSYGNTLVGTANGAAGGAAVTAGAIKINGVDIGAAAGTAVADTVTAINAKSNETGVTAVVAAGGRVVLANTTGAAINLVVSSADAATTLGRAQGTHTVAAGANGLIVTNTTKGGSVLANSGATALALGSADAAALTASVANTALSSIDVNTVSSANLAILAIDGSVGVVNGLRARLGAIQNRMESTIANLQTTTENLSASRSRIRDADFAAETANLTRAQILQQAGTAMLAQANALPQNVLTLLRG